MTEAPESFPGQADLEMVLLHAADAITVMAPDGTLVFANLAAARTLGFDSPEALLATPIREVMSHFDLLDEAGSPLPLDQLPSRRALAGQSGPPSVVRFRDVAGDDHWSLVQAMPILDEAGAVRLVINTFQDVSQLKRSEQQLRLLADAGAVLGRSVDYQQALQELADLLVGTIADWCVVDVIEPNQPVTRVAVAHSDSAKLGLAEEIQRRYPTDPNAPGGVHDVMRTGNPTVITEVSEEVMRAAARDDEHFRLLKEAGIESAVIVPLRARARCSVH